MPRLNIFPNKPPVLPNPLPPFSILIMELNPPPPNPPIPLLPLTADDLPLPIFLDNNPLNIIGPANPINPFSKPPPSIPALLSFSFIPKEDKKC